MKTSPANAAGPCVRRLPPRVFLALPIAFSLLPIVVRAGALPSAIDLASGVAGGMRVVGAQTGDQLAGKYFSPYSHTTHPIASGDLNGDGYDDLIIGAPEAANGSYSSAGAVYVIYGSASAGSTVDLSTTAPGLAILGGAPNDNLGAAVAVGDINGDGIDDLLIGAPSHDNPSDPIGGTGHGAVYVIYGSHSLPSSINFALAPSSADLTVYGNKNGDRLGQALASADINGDGYDDILAGAPAFGVPGRVEIIYGGASLPATKNLFSTDPDVRITGTAVADWTGEAVAAGDVNGDGYADILIGAAYAQASGGATAEGAVFMVEGSANLSGALALPGNANLAIHGDAANDHAGWSVASGDINADGYDDIVIGAPGANGGKGATYLIQGSAALSGTRELPGAADTLIQGSNSGDALGFAVASADLNGDGLDDLIIGAPGLIGGGTDKGKGYVFYGAANPAGTIDAASSAAVTLTGAAAGDDAGASVAGLGDIDRDGYPELAIGSPGADGTRGEAYVAPGGGSAASATRIKASRSGDPPVTDFGPVIRAAIDFASRGAGFTTVTLTRGNSGITGLSSDGTNADVGRGHWGIAIDASVTNAAVVLRYLDSEVAGLSASSLTVYQAATLAGPWSPANVQSVDLTRNEIRFTADPSAGSEFALKDTSSGGATTGPHVTALTPASGATGVSTDTTVKVVFDTSMSPGTLNATTFTLLKGNTPVSGKVAYDDSTHTATFTPASALAAGGSYTVTLTTGITAQDGHALANNVSWSFATAFTPIAIVPPATGGGGGGGMLGAWELLLIGAFGLAANRVAARSKAQG